MRRSPLAVIVKGVLRGDDAARCVDAGAKAVIVSNHGGRHLDTAIATADALGEIVDAVGSKAEVYVDGGIRRGTDILKALALGARAVLIGRPVVWGLAVHGADGVRDVLDSSARRAGAHHGAVRRGADRGRDARPGRAGDRADMTDTHAALLAVFCYIAPTR